MTTARRSADLGPSSRIAWPSSVGHRRLVLALLGGDHHPLPDRLDRDRSRPPSCPATRAHRPRWRRSDPFGTRSTSSSWRCSSPSQSASLAASTWPNTPATAGSTEPIRFAQEAISTVPSIVVGLFGLIALRERFQAGLHALSGRVGTDRLQPAADGALTEQAIRAVPQDERPPAWRSAPRSGRRSASGAAHRDPGHRHQHHPDRGPHLRRGRRADLHGRIVHADHYDFTNFDLPDPCSPWSPFHSATTLSVYIWKLNSEGIGASCRDRRRAAAILIVPVLLFNLTRGSSAAS